MADHPENPATAPAGAAPDLEILARQLGADGDELLLGRRGEHFEVRRDGRLLMASDRRRSERALAELALAPLRRDDVTVLLAGLGMGHTLRALLDQPGVVRVDVVELEPAIVDWNRGPLADLAGRPLDDPRVHLHTIDLLGFLKRQRYTPIAEVKDGWLALLMDLDDGPARLSRADNAVFYGEEGLRKLEAPLRHGGVLGLWTAERDVELLKRLHARFVQVAEMGVPVDVAGVAGLDYVYRGRRRPEPRSGAHAPAMPEA